LLKAKVNGKHWIEEWILNKRNVDLPIAQISGKCFPQNAAGTSAPTSLLNKEQKYRPLFL